MEKTKSFSNHIEFMVLMVTLIWVFYLLDGKIERSTSAQSERSDRLYEMFIDLLKEKK
jgi:hypothetical protein